MREKTIKFALGLMATFSALQMRQGRNLTTTIGIRPLTALPGLLGGGTPPALLPQLLWLALDAARSRQSLRPSVGSPFEGAKRRAPA